MPLTARFELPCTPALPHHCLIPSPPRCHAAYSPATFIRHHVVILLYHLTTAPAPSAPTSSLRPTSPVRAPGDRSSFNIHSLWHHRPLTDLQRPAVLTYHVLYPAKGYLSCCCRCVRPTMPTYLPPAAHHPHTHLHHHRAPTTAHLPTTHCAPGAASSSAAYQLFPSAAYATHSYVPTVRPLATCILHILLATAHHIGIH